MQIQREIKPQFNFEIMNNLFGANRKEILMEMEEMEDSKKKTWKNIMTSLSADVLEIKSKDLQAIRIEEEIL